MTAELAFMGAIIAIVLLAIVTFAVDFIREEFRRANQVIRDSKDI